MSTTQLVNEFKPISTKLRSISLLFLIPLFYIIAALKLASARGAYWLGIDYDPDYPYLLNSLNVANLQTPGHIDHPGTTVQTFGAIVIKISYFIESIFNPSLNSLNEAVLSNPEKYLNLINLTILLITISSIFSVGLISFLFFRSLSLSLVFQIIPFLTYANSLALSRVMPEPLLFCIGQILVIVLLFYLFKNDAENSKWLAIALGIIFGIGMATKMTFLPFILLFLIIPKIKLKTLALITSIATFIVATLPIAAKYQETLAWLVSIATHTGKYGQGDRGIIGTADIWKNTTWLFSHEKIFFSLVIVSSFVWGMVFLLNRLNDWDKDAEVKNLSVRKSNFIFGLIIAIFWLQILLTIKHPNIRYLIPSMSLCGLLIFVQVISLSALVKNLNFSRSDLFKKFLPSIALALCVSLCIYRFPKDFQNIAINYQVRAEDSAAIESIISEKYTNCLKILYHGSSSKEFALQFGNIYSSGNFANVLTKLYPEAIFYDFVSRIYSSYTGALQQSDLLDRECVIFQGWKFGGGQIGQEYYPENVNLQPIYIGHYQALYEKSSQNLDGVISISFIRQGNGSQATIYQKYGWGDAEDWGTWTVGKEASLALKLDPIPSKNLELIADVNPFVSEKHPQQNVDILVNGTELGSWNFRHGEINKPQKILIPAELINKNNTLEVTFRLNDAKSPVELDINSDTRSLGIGVKKIRILPSEN